jgi:sugar O-acyltransferase (sialic acid O-acetyltransferase NeuD family)
VVRRRLLIVGGGDFAREAAWFATTVPEHTRDWELAGCLDDTVTGILGRPGSVQVPVLGTIRDHQPAADEVFVCGIGRPSTKLACCAMLRARGAEFVNLIHPTAVVGPGTTLGTGVILATGVSLSIDVTVGDDVAFNFLSTAGHDAVVDAGCTISSYCDITGHAHLERGVFVGSHASVLPGVRVGAMATVGAGSVVTRRVAPERTVFGAPAKVIL